MSDKQKNWTDSEIAAAAAREMLDFDDAPAAYEEARARWALFERLRALDLDGSMWADLPSQEAFADLAEQGFRSAWSRGDFELRERSDLPRETAPSRFGCAPVEAAGQAGGSRSGSPFEPSPPELGARPGGEVLADWARSTPIRELAGLVREGRVDSEELARSFEARAARLEPSLGSLEAMFGREPGAPSSGALAGVPFASKSLFWVRGEVCSASSAMLSRFVAPADAPVVAGLRSAGAVPLASARMDEFAMGGDGSRSRWGATSHPLFPGRLPGGSSSGSAAALAAGLCMFATGSDTGGSVRIPASHCGLFGLKPTYGALSRFGMVPYAFSLDCPGSFALGADDLAMVHEAMGSGPVGWDERQGLWDARGFAARARALAGSGPRPWAGLRVGIERRWLASCDAPAREAFGAWEERARGLGAQVVDASLPSADRAVWAYYLLACCEAQSSLARYDPSRMGWEREAREWGGWESAARAARRGLMGAEPRARALLGAMALSEPSRGSLYAKACALRRQIALDWSRAFSQVDLVASPATSGPPPLAGVRGAAELEWAQDRLCVPASLGGVCAASAPWAERSDGFPMGVQLCAPWWGDLRLAAALIGAERAGAFGRPPR